jgi:hypothetical protein
LFRSFCHLNLENAGAILGCQFSVKTELDGAIGRHFIINVASIGMSILRVVTVSTRNYFLQTEQASLVAGITRRIRRSITPPANPRRIKPNTVFHRRQVRRRSANPTSDWSMVFSFESKTSRKIETASAPAGDRHYPLVVCLLGLRQCIVR